MHLDLTAHCLHIVNSYRHFTGKELLPANFKGDMVDYLFNAPFALVSHTTQEDPVFNYGNKTAQMLWEMNWEEFTALPSRLSAEPIRREERQHLLEQVGKFGFIDNYVGIRISKSGKRFSINEATVWNLIDEKGNKIGQAAMFSKWGFQ